MEKLYIRPILVGDRDFRLKVREGPGRVKL